MKKHFLELLFFSLVSTVNINGQLTNGLKAYYPFSGDVNDNSGQSHNGRIIGNPTLTTDRFGPTLTQIVITDIALSLLFYIYRIVLHRTGSVTTTSSLQKNDVIPVSKS